MTHDRSHAVPALGLALILGLAITSSASAQCFTDTGKHTCFEYTGVEARTFLLDGTWHVRDWAGSLANPNELVPGDPTRGYLWVRVTLTAADPSFVYAPNCANPDPSGQCIGTYQFPDIWFNAYASGERWVGRGVQGRTPYPQCDDADPAFDWSGTVRIESVAKEHLWLGGVIVAPQPFYSYSPFTFTTGDHSRAGGTCIEAFREAWQLFSAPIPATWDPDIERWVVPYANFWHNHEEFPRGWQTLVTISSTQRRKTNVTVENHLVGGEHGHPGDPCNRANENSVETTIQIRNGQTIVVDPFRSHIPDDARAWHDTVLFIRASREEGITPSVMLTPNPAGTNVCMF